MQNYPLNNPIRASLFYCLILLSACQSNSKHKADPKNHRPTTKNKQRQSPPRKAQQALSKMLTGAIEDVDDSSITVRGKRWPVASGRVTRDLDVRDDVMLTVHNGIVVRAQKFKKNPIMRSLLPPKAPEVGDLISIDQVVGLVLHVEDLNVTMRVRDGGQFIGKTTLPLRATTSLRILKKARPKLESPKLLGDKPVAQSIPKEGIWTQTVLTIDGDDRAKKEIFMTMVAAKDLNNNYAVTVIVENKGTRKLNSFTLNLDFKSFGKKFNFGALRVSQTTEAIPSQGRRRFSIRGRPLIGTPRQIRVMISELEFQ
jgi:hypothetical protein